MNKKTIKTSETDAMRAVLTCWDVQITPNPEIESGVLPEINNYRTLPGFLKYHRALVSVAVCCLCLVGGLSGFLLAQQSVETARTQIVLAYLSQIDPRIHTGLIETGQP
ncbi:MAG: hypothetical protein SFY80_13275 [Verrucomicrobiota bacterium]|nr:hypothetical protein [Verrucomicrobiota bacterium]